MSVFLSKKNFVLILFCLFSFMRVHADVSIKDVSIINKDGDGNPLLNFSDLASDGGWLSIGYYENWESGTVYTDTNAMAFVKAWNAVGTADSNGVSTNYAKIGESGAFDDIVFSYSSEEIATDFQKFPIMVLVGNGSSLDDATKVSAFTFKSLKDENVLLTWATAMIFEWQAILPLNWVDTLGEVENVLNYKSIGYIGTISFEGTANAYAMAIPEPSLISLFSGMLAIMAVRFGRKRRKL